MSSDEVAVLSKELSKEESHINPCEPHEIQPSARSCTRVRAAHNISTDWG